MRCFQWDSATAADSVPRICVTAEVVDSGSRSRDSLTTCAGFVVMMVSCTVQCVQCVPLSYPSMSLVRAWIQHTCVTVIPSPSCLTAVLAALSFLLQSSVRPLVT